MSGSQTRGWTRIEYQAAVPKGCGRHGADPIWNTKLMSKGVSRRNWVTESKTERSECHAPFEPLAADLSPREIRLRPALDRP